MYKYWTGVAYGMLVGTLAELSRMACVTAMIWTHVWSGETLQRELFISSRFSEIHRIEEAPASFIMLLHLREVDFQEILKITKKSGLSEQESDAGPDFGTFSGELF